MSVDGERERDLRHLIDGICSESKGVKNEGVIKEENLAEDGNLKVNGIAENVKDSHGGALQSPARLHLPQQPQSCEGIVCWEKFLHLRSLKVLLVENDDSTRHIVSALLRNCSYEVIETENGLQAWKILEDLTNHIDLVLTEVAMPGMSGIGLLCKIMSHLTRKNIPVIMMSSQDSMGLLFTCLSKGAVDFLVKPLRKNELKNLWQHVWRRCQSSSDSGSESGTQTQKSVKSKSIKQSDNNTGSNEDEDDGSIGLNIGDGSDQGSGTQSSWTKQAAEADSPQALDKVAGRPDSTCAQVIHSNAEIPNDKLDRKIPAKERQEQGDQLDEDGNGAEREIMEPRNLDLPFKHLVEDPVKVVGMRQSNLLESGHGRFTEQIDGQLHLNSASTSNKLKYEVVDLTVVTAKSGNSHGDHVDFEAPSMHLKISDIGSKTIGDPKEVSPFECSPRRSRVIQDIGREVQEDRNVLRQSESSAFSRYSGASQASKVPGVNLKSGSPQDSSLDVAKNVLVYNKHSDSNGCDPNQCSNIGSNNVDRGSTTNNSAMKSLLLKIDSSVMFSFKCSHLLSASQTMKSEMPRHSSQEKANETASTILLAQQSSTHHELQMQHHIQKYEYCDYFYGAQKQNQQEQLLADVSLSKKTTAAAPQCESSNVLNSYIAGNAGNYSIIRSASGGNHGSNGQNGSSTAANPGSTNVAGGNIPAGQSGSVDASGSGSGSGSGNKVDESRIAQREAALTKFRQKRKERCFRKKVRYQSRKRLAGQRPRVRGQFVRQVANENASGSTES